MKKNKDMSKKCKLKKCLLNEKGFCNIDIPITTPTYDSINCKYYSESLDDDMIWLKKNGGIMNILLKQNNKSTEAELQKEKKKRKASKK